MKLGTGGVAFGILLTIALAYGAPAGEEMLQAGGIKRTPAAGRFFPRSNW